MNKQPQGFGSGTRRRGGSQSLMMTQGRIKGRMIITRVKFKSDL
jgi:hypothetical protein